MDLIIKFPATSAILMLPLGACGADHMSQEAASQVARAHIARVTDASSASLQIREVFAKEHEGVFSLCGVLAAPSISPRRFIVVNAPGRDPMFERPAELGQPETYNFGREWNRICATAKS